MYVVDDLAPREPRSSPSGISSGSWKCTTSIFSRNTTRATRIGLDKALQPAGILADVDDPDVVARIASPSATISETSNVCASVRRLLAEYPAVVALVNGCRLRDLHGRRAGWNTEEPCGGSLSRAAEHCKCRRPARRVLADPLTTAWLTSTSRLRRVFCALKLPPRHFPCLYP